MRFTKMEGTGNDYLYVDLFEERVEDAPALARAMSDRHFGVGADGLILMGPSATADVAMVMYNADGSRAEMCGNGIRCLAKLAWDRGRSRRNPMRIETDAGVREVELRLDGGRAVAARVGMGVPSLEPDVVPVKLPGPRVVDREIEAAGRKLKITCVSMGNPHAVVYVEDVARFDVAGAGAAVESHEIFPRKTNVEFVQVLDERTVIQRTWERGSGETLSCGTGACAVCVAGVVTGRTGSPLEIRLRGGVLRLEWDGAGEVFKEGPAVEVFTGEWPAAAARAHGV